MKLGDTVPPPSPLCKLREDPVNHSNTETARVPSAADESWGESK
jgi:hypothetical protein